MDVVLTDVEDHDPKFDKQYLKRKKKLDGWKRKGCPRREH
jgi:hypothetical protein